MSAPLALTTAFGRNQIAPRPAARLIRRYFSPTMPAQKHCANRKTKGAKGRRREMRTRIVILLALAVAGIFLVSPAPVFSQTATAPLLLKGQSSHPASANLHLIFKLWAETVEKMSGGRLKVEALPGGAIVPPFEVFDATSKGVLDVGMAPFGYIQGRNTATIPMSHGPLFGMDGNDYYAWYYDGGGM
jgi:TRAP-type mannitol/chloroaromatic compound transport system substrate-binding protein